MLLVRCITFLKISSSERNISERIRMKAHRGVGNDVCCGGAVSVQLLDPSLHWWNLNVKAGVHMCMELTALSYQLS